MARLQERPGYVGTRTFQLLAGPGACPAYPASSHGTGQRRFAGLSTESIDTAPVTKDPRAARLHSAARRLCAAGKGGDQHVRLTRMATTAPQAWSEPMIQAAAATMQDLTTDLIEVGVDPSLLPTPSTQALTSTPQPAVPVATRIPAGWQTPAAANTADATQHHPPPTTPTQPTVGPFVYDGTVDGLRGIPITELAAVRRRDEARFSACGIRTIYDLLTHVPLRYIDRSTRTPIAHLVPGEAGTTIARVAFTSLDTVGGDAAPRPGEKPKKKRQIARIGLVDDTGKLTASFFNAPWQAKRFAKGDEVVVQGRLEIWERSPGDRRLQMKSPLIDKVGDNTAYIVPVYPQSAKAELTTWAIHRAAMEAVTRLGDLADPIPAEITRNRDLIERVNAYRLVHRPDQAGEEKTGRERLAYDELLRMQLALLMRKHSEQATAGVAHQPTGLLTQQFLDRLPYPLTSAQTRVVGEIVADMRRTAPMHRLIQGDVGSGKTWVAVLALLSAVEGGSQAALMAPTEVLANQHYKEIASLLDGIQHPTQDRPLRVVPLTNKVRSRARREHLAALAAGEVDLVVGTHALLADDVEFDSLGLVVIDEQHRFGVEQRAALRDKGGETAVADLLVMTATPIPRTAAMSVFGDLDLSVIDELPPGRTPIATDWVDADVDLSNAETDPWTLVRAEVTAGRQAYVVCPLVEESETLAAKSATETLEALTAGALKGLRIGMVHGKQKPDERDVTMAAFKAGDVDVLVATTVIEVGVNVPNATVIVILDAARFGMAQLHQLRGRVGRGSHASHCVLAGTTTSADSTRRLEAMCETTDGFVLSEIDLDIRGEGSVFGARQSGMSDLRVASLRDDRELVAKAREDAKNLLHQDPALARRPGLRAEVHTALGPDAEEWLTRS